MGNAPLSELFRRGVFIFSLCINLVILSGAFRGTKNLSDAEILRPDEESGLRMTTSPVRTKEI